MLKFYLIKNNTMKACFLSIKKASPILNEKGLETQMRIKAFVD